MIDFLRSRNIILIEKIEDLETKYSNIKEYLDEYIEFQKMNSRDKRIEKLLE